MLRSHHLRSMEHYGKKMPHTFRPVSTKFGMSRQIFFAEVRNIKFPTEIRDRRGKTGKRTDMTKLTGALYFATTRSRDQWAFPPRQILWKSAHRLLSLLHADGRTDKHGEFLQLFLGNASQYFAATVLQCPVLPVQEQEHRVDGQHLTSVTRLHSVWASQEVSNRRLQKTALRSSWIDLCLTNVIIVTWCEGQQKGTQNFGSKTSQRAAALIT